MPKSFSQLEREWERLQETLPGGPGDPELDADYILDDYDFVADDSIDNVLMKAMDDKEPLPPFKPPKSSSKSFRDNFDPRVDGPWHYEGHGSKY